MSRSGFCFIILLGTLNPFSLNSSSFILNFFNYFLPSVFFSLSWNSIIWILPPLDLRGWRAVLEDRALNLGIWGCFQAESIRSELCDTPLVVENCLELCWGGPPTYTHTNIDISPGTQMELHYHHCCV